MAKKRKPQDTSSVDTSLFNKGMIKDINASFAGKQTWSHARNAYNNSEEGDVGLLGNEPANFSCADIPYTVIGAIHLYADKWTIFCTDDFNSEIGLFDDSECIYETVINDPCLNFNKTYLIKGASKENFNCTWQVYWDDGTNPSRTLNLDDIPYFQEVNPANQDPANPACIVYSDKLPLALDCEKIRLAPLVTTPCVKLRQADDGGQLRNGSYQAFVCYTVNGQRIGDYIGMSNLISIFDHEDQRGAIQVELSNLDVEFDYFELVIVSVFQANFQAKKIGLYSTEQTIVHLDYINPQLPAVPLNILPLINPAYEKSDAMYVVNDWLIRSGPVEQFDFNYQPLANEITAKFVVGEFNEDYYYNAGQNPTFLRDEVYAFFIRFVYNTGERSSSYHIPGRGPEAVNIPQIGVIQEDAQASGLNALETNEKMFDVYNTAKNVTQYNTPVPFEDGKIIGEGDMAYWESTEIYSPTRPDIWAGLCGRPIRHHKMPFEGTHKICHLSDSDSTSNNVADKIRLIGVKFDNIANPVDNDGNPILNITGYELLRGSREGNKSIIGKGLVKNMRKYVIPTGEFNTDPSGITGLYPNYPYNDNRWDVFHTVAETEGRFKCKEYPDELIQFPSLGWEDHGGVSDEDFTFHSPDLMFRKPALAAHHLRIYGMDYGWSTGKFITSEDHPKYKLLKNGAALLAILFGIGYALDKMRGRTKKRFDSARPYSSGMSQSAVIPVTQFGWGGYGLGTIASVPSSLSMVVIEEIKQLIVDDLLLGNVSFVLDAIGGGGGYDFLMSQGSIVSNAMAALYGGYEGGATSWEKDGSAHSSMPGIMKMIKGFFTFITHVTTGGQEIIDLIYNFCSYRDFVFKYNSYGLFGQHSDISNSVQFRSKLENQSYLNNSFQMFGITKKINNLFRPKTVAIATEQPIPRNPGKDYSRFSVSGAYYGSEGYGNLGPGGQGNPLIYTDPTKPVRSPISSWYGGLKFSFQNQYGQLDGIQQVPMRGCINDMSPDGRLYSSDNIFGGDTYVNRYTEKCIMPIFWEFLKGQPDGFPFDYRLRVNIPYPRWWLSGEKYQLSAIAQAIYEIPSGLMDMIGGNNNQPQYGNQSNQSAIETLFDNAFPSDLHHLDRPWGDCQNFPSFFGGMGGGQDQPGVMKGLFHLKNGYMYTHVSGINDFFVESEVNVAKRDWEDKQGRTHYDEHVYGDINELFHANIIGKGNFYKYDYSLSISRFFSNLISFGQIQPRDYDPEIAETCWTYYPKRLIYSLRAQKEAKKDFWRVYLPLNYKDFKSKVNVIKPINKSGALIMFPYLSPQMFQGLDQIKMGSGNKITIGDGGLFEQPFQNVVNSDISNEYGSCESMRSVINTPSGLFYLSQAQGKVFNYSGQGLENIANRGMKWWFNNYLPSRLLKALPELEGNVIIDNPVVGVGCQAIYDPNDDIVYFCKKDYDIKDEYKGCIEYDVDLGFVYNQSACSNFPPALTCPPGFFLDGDGNCVEIVEDTPAEMRYGGETVTICPGEGYTLQNSRYGSYQVCYKKRMSPPMTTPQLLPIHLGDPLYFNDVSWTVSYDPKAKAWISFHDWHPELCLPSITHFLTTKTLERENIECPDGWAWNPDSQMCEKLEEECLLANVSVIEMEMELPEPGSTGCVGGTLSYDKLSDPSIITNNWTRFAFFTQNRMSTSKNSGLPNYLNTGMSYVDGSISRGVGTYFEQYNDWDMGSHPGPSTEGVGSNPPGAKVTAAYRAAAIIVNPGYPFSANTPLICNFANWKNYYFNTSQNKYCVCEGWSGDGANYEWATYNPTQDTGQSTGNPTAIQGLTTSDHWELKNLVTKSCINDANSGDWTMSDPDGNGQVTVIPASQKLTFDQKIYAKKNSSLINGFYSVCGFNDYTFAMTVNSHGGDDDTIGIVLAAFKDVNGDYGPVDVTHSLTLTFNLVAHSSFIRYNYTAGGFSFRDGSDPDTSITNSLMLEGYCPWGTGGGGKYSTKGSVRAMIIRSGSNFKVYLSPQMQGNGVPTHTYHPVGCCDTNPGLAPCEFDPYYGWTTQTPEFDFDLDDPATWLDAQAYASNPALPGGGGVPNTEALLKFSENPVRIGFLTHSQPKCGFFDIEFSGEQEGDEGCKCPEGFTTVFQNPEDGQYTASEGNCQGGDCIELFYEHGCPPEYPIDMHQAPYNEPLFNCGTAVTGAPILCRTCCTGEVPTPGVCRKVECICPPSPFGGTTTRYWETGKCNDVYGVGDTSYINNNPKTCCFEHLKQQPPENEYGSIWKHNQRCDLFANYYNVDYPWEVELVETTGQAVNTIRSLEYQLECYVYKGNGLNNYECGDDRWHDLDFNFDEAVIYNTEQVSGLLKLNLNPKSDPVTALQYPLINPSDIDILYTKEEQKYRFDQFWDVTADRGEFTNAEQQIWLTQLNGYIKDLNTTNLNYNKAPTQRKKFRHYWNKAILRRRISGNRKMLLKLVNTKLNLSFR